MLQYEWTWLRQHIEPLQFSVSDSSMFDEIGGRLRGEALVEESWQFAIVLDEEFKKRMLNPKNHSRPVEAGEHAWNRSAKNGNWIEDSINRIPNPKVLCPGSWDFS
jgi:hypothetical protein